MKGYKVVKEDHIHHGFKYQEGLNIDPKPFRDEGSCVEGGLYFFEKITDVVEYLGYGVYLYEVTVPQDQKYVKDPDGDKYRASGLILSNPLDLRKASSWEYLIAQDTGIHVVQGAVLRWSARKGYLEVVKYCTSQGADIHAGDEYALRWAVREGHSEVVKYLVENGADIHVMTNHSYKNIW